MNALKELASSQGVELSVAMVTGDDLMKYVSYKCTIIFALTVHLNVSLIMWLSCDWKLQEIKDSGLAVDMDSGLPLPKSVLSMNAYLG